MAGFQIGVATVLLLAVLLGLWRVFLGPSAGDRMLAAQLLGTGGVGVLLLLGEALVWPSLSDIALIFGLLAAVTAVAFSRSSGREPSVLRRWDKARDYDA